MKSKLLFCCLLLQCMCTLAQSPSVQNDIALWKQLKQQPVTDNNFKQVCDLLQRIGKTQLDTSYAILAEYTPIVKATGNRWQTHVLLMGWAKAKESFSFFDEAETLYQQAKLNADTGRLYREVMVAMLLMYAEWDKRDSVSKYAQSTEKICKEAGDAENLSFVYTFSTLPLLLANKLDSAKILFEKAVAAAENVPDKNALFTARYNYANYYCRNNPQEQVMIYTGLLELSKDSSLNHYPHRLYDRTAFTFRNAKLSATYQLLQVCQLLTDYEGADKYARQYYDLAIAPNPGSVQAPVFNAEFAIVCAHQGKWAAARQHLDNSRKLFNKPESEIVYPSYFVAAGLVAEHENRNADALGYFHTALVKGSTMGLHIIPTDLYYAHSLVQNGRLQEAEAVFKKLPDYIASNQYSAPQLYYYLYYAELLKAKGDQQGYINALTRFYNIKDSLNSFNRYRAVQEIQAKLDVKEKEQQIQVLHQQQVQREKSIRQERIWYASLGVLGILVILFLALYLRNRQIRNKQQQVLQQNRLEQLEKQQHIERMQSAMQAEENERNKIAGQLHDEVNALLAVATLNISSLLEKKEYNEQTARMLYKTQEAITAVNTTVRNISHRLTPMMIERYGFRAAVEDIADAINQSGKINTETVIIGFEDTSRYNTAFLIDLYRIIQELLQNIIKHADATHATLELIEHEQHISLMVEDDGTGFDAQALSQGMGLQNIRSKIQYLNGVFEIKNKNDKGTLVVIELPVTNTNN